MRKILKSEGGADWPDRMLVTDSQRVRDPIKWKQSAVMSQGWRLVNGKELYQIDSDPGQKNNISSNHPERVKKMRAFYDAWWAELEPTFARTTELYIGHPDHPLVSLTSHDWIQEAYPPWNQQQNEAKLPVRPNSRGLKHDGHWAIKVLQEGQYNVEVRRWPQESGKKINEALPAGTQVPGADKAFRAQVGFGIEATAATCVSMVRIWRPKELVMKWSQSASRSKWTGAFTNCPLILLFRKENLVATTRLLAKRIISAK